MIGKKEQAVVSLTGKNKLASSQMEAFAVYFVSQGTYGNGTHSYALAYDVDIEGWQTDKKKMAKYKYCCQRAGILLKNPKVAERINFFLDSAGFNDVNVDKQHLSLINQHFDPNVKLGAIKEYNRLKGRVQNVGDGNQAVSVIVKNFSDKEPVVEGEVV